MSIFKNDRQGRLNRMIRTLLVLFAAIVLQDICTGMLKWYWPLLMVIVTACLYIFNAATALKQRSNAEIARRLIGKTDIRYM